MNYCFPNIVVVVLLGISFFSCVKKPKYPSEPVIAYKDFLRYGNPSDPDSIQIVISFTDNEGDIGLTQPDLQGVLKNGNVCIYDSYWDTLGGTPHWTLVDANIATAQIDTNFFYFTVPPVLPSEDPSEPVKGLIFIKQRPFIKIFDQIKYTLYMYDLAKHKSNTIETPPITFP